MATKKWSAVGIVTSITEATDWVMGLVGGDNARITIAALRARLGIGNQTIIGDITHTGDQTTSGKITASEFEGDGSALTGIGSGTGGVINTGSTTIGADSDDNGSGVIALQIGGVTKAGVNNNGEFESDNIKPLTPGSGVFIDGVTIKDGGITTTADRKYGNSYGLQDQSLLDSKLGPFLNFKDGDVIQVADDSKYANIYNNGGTYWCHFNMFSAGEGSAGRFYTKSSTIRVLTGLLYLTHAFTVTNASFRIALPTLNQNSVMSWSYDNSNVSNVPTVYIDGVPITVTVVTPPVGVAIDDAGSDLYISSNSVPNASFNGNKYRERFFNYEFTEEQHKAYSNPLKALDFPDIGGSNVAQNVSNVVNDGYDSVVNITPTGFDAVVATAGSTAKVDTADEIEVKAGNYYAVDLDNQQNSGDLAGVLLRESPSGTVLSALVKIADGDVQRVVLQSNATTTAILQFQNLTGESSDYEIRNLNIHQLGATLELDPRNSSKIQAKDSMNGNHGLLLPQPNKILVNQPVSPAGGEIYKAVANTDTFDLPENTTGLKITIDVRNADAGKVIRIGTTPGGQEVVADLTLAVAEPLTATILIDNYKAGDTLHIGDGGGAWTVDGPTLHTNYTVIDIK